jgi:hypothetical protein
VAEVGFDGCGRDEQRLGSWSSQPISIPAGATHSVLFGVSCTTPTSCVSVGDYVNASGLDVTLAESYTG